MDWIAGIVAQCVMLGLIGWFLARRNESAIRDALKFLRSDQDINLDSAQVRSLLASGAKRLPNLAEHSDRLEQSADDPQYDLASPDEIRSSDQCPEQSIDSTIEDLVTACADLGSDEKPGLDERQETTSIFDATREGITQGELLVHIACTLLDMNRELRADFNMVQNEVAASKDQIIHLLSRASSAEHLARIDALTEMPNRLALNEAYSHCEKILGQSGHPFSLILIDIDHFKAVNDSYGHVAGDALLVLVARTLQQHSKTADFACRVGGEEFAVLLPRCAKGPAIEVAERYRQAIESMALRYADHDISITVSCGIAQAIPGKTQSDLLKRADTALYAAKSRGRNQTCVDGEFDGSLEIFKRR